MTEKSEMQKRADFLSFLLKPDPSPAETETQRILREAVAEEMAAREKAKKP